MSGQPPVFGFESFPFTLLAGWAALEMAIFAARRAAGGKSPAWAVLATWSVRPWACWAAFNLLARALWEHGFNDPLTFPFYASPWNRNETFPQTTMRLALKAGTMRNVFAALLFACALIWIALRAAGRGEPGRARSMAAMAAMWAAAAGFVLSAASLPNPSKTNGAPCSILAPWHIPGSTMLYAMPLVKNAGDFLSNYRALQPRLRPTIHGLSHPPGAPISLYWMGRIAGAGKDIGPNSVKLRYMLAMAGFGLLNVFAIFALGDAVAGDRRAGIVAALFWALCPAAGLYATFAHDIFYALFFNCALLLAWQTQTSPRFRPFGCAALGVVLFCLAMLTYSWAIMAAALCAFGAIMALRETGSTRAAAARAAARVGAPLAVTAALLGAVMLAWRLDYIGAYGVARAFVEQWYRYTGAYQRIMALVGGQIELLLMMGGAVCAAFLVALRRALKARPIGADVVFLLCLLAVYAIPVLIGPNALKMETSRCWHWVTGLPIVFAARLVCAGPRPAFFIAGAAMVSAATTILLSLFLDFGL